MTNGIEKQLDELNTQLQKAKLDYQTKAQAIFKQIFAEFFKQNPEVNVVGWSQFTPYFNDGDECVFHCNAGYAFVSNAKDYDHVKYGEYEGEEEDVWVNDGDYGPFNEEIIPENVFANSNKLRNTLSKIDDSVYRDMFDDHVIVYATREGFDVREYHHD